MSQRISREEALFVDALALPEQERLSFLFRACETSPALRARVLALLAAHASPDTLAPPAFTPRPVDGSGPPLPPERSRAEQPTD